MDFGRLTRDRSRARQDYFQSQTVGAMCASSSTSAMLLFALPELFSCGARDVVVFDIDETLLNNLPTILASDFGVPFHGFELLLWC
jgi:hypothetical protein